MQFILGLIACVGTVGMQPGVFVCPGGINTSPQSAPHRAILGGYWSSISFESEVGAYVC